MFISRRHFLASTAAAGLATRFFDDDPPAQLERTKASMEAVEAGKKWLRGTICQNGGHGTDRTQNDDIGCTAMVGLALLADGSTPNKGEHRRQLQNITKYLIEKVRIMPAGNITSTTNTQLQNKIGVQAHSFFALLYLSQVIGEVYLNEATLSAAKKLTETVVGAQTPDGHWGQTAWAPTLGTVMGWVSLQAANTSGLAVGGSPQKTAKHLIQQMQTNLNQRGRGWMHTLYKNATGIRVLYAMEMEDEAIAKQCFTDVVDLVKNGNTAFNQAGGEEYLAFHLITETMLQKGGEDWKTWFPLVRDKIIGVQNADGSWTGHHCITSRTFCTAAAILVLSAPNRYLPISQQ